MTSASPRPTDDYVWAMEQWLTCTLLSAHEISIITWMKDMLTGGTPWSVVLSFVVNNHWPQIVTAVAKARSQGILREWRTNAEVH